MSKEEERIKLMTAWVKAAADVIEFDQVPFQAVTTRAATETVNLCLFSCVVPSAHAEEFMNRMNTLQNELMDSFSPVVSTQRELH